MVIHCGKDISTLAYLDYPGQVRLGGTLLENVEQIRVIRVIPNYPQTR